MADSISLSQQGNSMFERNIAIIGGRSQEVRVFSDGFVYIGFLCGLDANWIQIYGHEEAYNTNHDSKWRFLLIGRDNISAIGPTGQTLDDYSVVERDWIRAKISVFVNVCEKYSKSRGNKANDVRRAEED